MNGKPVVASLLEKPFEKRVFQTFPKTFMVIYDELVVGSNSSIDEIGRINFLSFAFLCRVLHGQDIFKGKGV